MDPAAEQTDKKTTERAAKKKPPLPEIDDVIERVEVLYRSITGQNPRIHDSSQTPAPSETDAAVQIERQIDHLLTLLTDPRVPCERTCRRSRSSRARRRCWSSWTFPVSRATASGWP